MLDFQAVKASVTFADVITKLGLQLKQQGNQWRGACPVCNSDNKRALVVTEGKGFYCFAAQAGGDQLALVSHIKNCSVKEAAQFLSAVPESEGGKETQKLQPLAYLEPDHPAVQAIGFDVETAARLGIGYAPKGILRGTVAVPIRLPDGTLSGYVGIESATLPPNFR